MAFVRFVIYRKQKGTNHLVGLFHALDLLRDNTDIPKADKERAAKLYQWFNRELPIPDRFRRSNNYRANITYGLSWFKDSASDFIREMRELSHILEANGFLVEMLTTKKPGYVVYEDEFQIVAEPFSDTFDT